MSNLTRKVSQLNILSPEFPPEEFARTFIKDQKTEITNQNLVL
jgi:hypothetical protein